jgi:hypothetical protein
MGKLVLCVLVKETAVFFVILKTGDVTAEELSEHPCYIKAEMFRHSIYSSVMQLRYSEMLLHQKGTKCRVACGVGAQGDPSTATISDLLCVNAMLDT